MVFSYQGRRREALTACRFIMRGAPRPGPTTFFRQIPSADSQLFQEADGVAEIWKVLNNLLVEGTGEGEEGRKGGEADEGGT